MPPTTNKSTLEANMQLSTSNILSIIDNNFKPDEIHAVARQTKFIQRSTSKIKGHEFVKALILPSNGICEESLNGLCERIREFNPTADLSAPALAQRINTISAVRFMKEVFTKLLNSVRESLEKQYTSLNGVLKVFNNILIQDSTVFELNKKLANVLPGTKRGGKKGGSSCLSQMKVDLIHNFTTGKIQDVRIYEGKRPDQALTSRIEQLISKNDLIIRDLGYFKISSLKMIEIAQAYFLTRFPSHVKVFLNPGDEEPVALAIHLNKYFKRKKVIDFPVWIGDERLKVRMVAYRIPKDIIAKRRRMTHKRAKEMGRITSQEKLALLDFSLFVTNIPSEMISEELIGTIYRIRWEIELIFRNWKSQLKFDFLQGICIYRIACLIYARLCTVLILAHITAGFMNLAKRLCEGELSPVKLIEYLFRNGNLSRAVQAQALEEFENKMAQDLPKRLLKDKRSRTTMRQRAIDSETYYEWCYAV